MYKHIIWRSKGTDRTGKRMRTRMRTQTGEERERETRRKAKANANAYATAVVKGALFLPWGEGR
jgi:hypothetical protein